MTSQSHHTAREPALSGQGSSAALVKIAVVLHLYHAKQWSDFQRYLLKIPYSFKLFVSLPMGSSMGSEIMRSFPDADINPVPNNGRDVAPLLSILDKLQDFDAVCKIHSKSDIGGHGQWRKIALDGLLGSSELIARYVEAFGADPEIAIAGPKSLYLDGVSHEMACHTTLHLLHAPVSSNWGFFAGTMFWFRPSYYVDLSAQYPAEIFEAHLDGDGQPEHVVERAFGVIAAQMGLKVMFGGPRAEIALATEMMGALNWPSIYKRLEEQSRAEPSESVLA